MGLSSASLKHPRLLWEIEAALWQCIGESLYNGFDVKTIYNANGREIIKIDHDRTTVPAFSFWKDDKEVTNIVLKALRESACES